MSDGKAAGPFGLYRGWSVLGAGLVCSALTIGSTIYIFGMLVLPISEEFGLSRAGTNTGLIALLVGMAIWGAAIGRIVDKTSIRIVMPVGGLFMTAGALAIALAQSPYVMLFSAFLLLAIGTICGGSLAANTVVSRWFRKRRGRAMGLMALATSAGGLIIPPVTALLIGAFGWRITVAILGLVIGPLIAIVSLWLMRDQPGPGTLQDAGELDQQTSATDGDPINSGEEPEWSIREMLRSREFWLLQFAFAFLMGSDQALLSLKIPYYLSKGVTLEAASLLLAVQTASAIVGKISIGFLSERFDVRRIYAIICALHVVALFFFINWPGYWTMLTLLGCLGVAIGGVLPVKLVLIATVFGSRSFGQVIGAMTILIQVFSITFIYISGKAFDDSGNYNLAFWLFMGGAVISLILSQMVRLPGREKQNPARAGGPERSGPVAAPQRL